VQNRGIGKHSLKERLGYNQIDQTNETAKGGKFKKKSN